MDKLKRNFNDRVRETPPLYIKEPGGRYREASDSEIIKTAIDAINTQFTPGTEITEPGKAQDFLKLHLGALEHELFAVLWLDNRHRVIAFEELFRGTIDGSSIYPREVVKSALGYNAAACILAHNHPSGVGEPSNADQNITQKIKAALSVIEVRTLDHIIIGEHTCSLAERGLM